MKKVSAIAAFMTFILLLTSCGGTSSSKNTTSTNTNAETTTAETPETAVTEAEFFIKKEDNNGLEFRILTTDYASYEYAVEEENGEIVNDAIYKRNTDVEELLGIKFSYIVNGDGLSANEGAKVVNKTIEASVLADDNSFDLISSTIVTTIPLSGNGYFVDLLTDSAIAFDSPWWISTLKDEIAINDHLYGVLGDCSLSLYKDISVIYFNKTLFEKYNLEDPYALVQDGKWTLDKYLTLAQNGGTDLDGDGQINPATDQLWNVGTMVPNRAFMTSCNISIIDRDENGISFLALPENLVDVCEKLYPFFSSEYTYVDPTGDSKLYAGYFGSGRSLFMNSFLYQTDYLRDMDDDFGIVPYPKLDEQQDGYYSQTGTSSTMNFIPITNKNIELASKVLDSMGYYGSKNVTPVYYESALKEKYTRDIEVREMLDIIRESATMNFLFAHAMSFSNPYPCAILNFRPGETYYESLSSWYESRLSAWNVELEKLLESYRD